MNDTPCDLQFIAQHVTEWPEDCDSVRLDADGEICFIPESDHDFFVEPEGTYGIFPGEEHPAFIPASRTLRATGVHYGKRQWEEARNENQE